MDKKEKDGVEVVIETPRGCRNKYNWDEKTKGFRLKKILPAGLVFPLDFGFIPGTKGGDGDPVDVLVLMDEPAFPGCTLECRIIGALKAKQKERDGRVDQNDRVVGVSVLSELYKNFNKIDALPEQTRKGIESFFVSYNALAGKTFMPEGWADAADAKKLIDASK